MNRFAGTPLYRYPHPLREVMHRYRTHLKTMRDFWLVITLPTLVFLGAVATTYLAISFSSSRISNSVTDIILSNTPVFDVDGIYVYGLVCLILFITFLCLVHPKHTPFTLYSLSLFMVIRSFFVILTHLAPYPIAASPDFGATTTKIFFGGDFFFSGHVGSPFLMALLYWRDALLRYTFLIWSVFFAAVVLLGHLHYSIDVFAAFFITYTIYHMALYFFPYAHELFNTETPTQTIEIV